MNIISNQVGNYGPAPVGQANHRTQAAREAARKLMEAEMAQQKVSGLNSIETKSAAVNAAENINSDEKEFFVNLYPQNQNEITDYHFYQKSGKMSGVSVGSLFDRRG